MNSGITSQWLENVINRYVQLDPESSNKLAEFQGKVLCIDVQGLNKQFYVVPEEDRLNIKDFPDVDGVTVEPDTTIKGTPAALVKLALQADAAPLMLTGEVEIIGDVRLGRHFKRFVAQLDVDWEEQVATVIGDVPANMAFSVVDKFSSWTKRALSSVSQDISEYLQEETRDVVTGVEIEIFNKKVDQLRNDVDRLEAILKSKIN